MAYAGWMPVGIYPEFSRRAGMTEKAEGGGSGKYTVN
jgi:hypothetical protein